MLLLGFVKSGFMHLESTEDGAAPAEIPCGSWGMDTLEAPRATGGCGTLQGPPTVTGAPCPAGVMPVGSSTETFPSVRASPAVTAVTVG